MAWQQGWINKEDWYVRESGDVTWVSDDETGFLYLRLKSMSFDWSHIRGVVSYAGHEVTSSSTHMLNFNMHGEQQEWMIHVTSWASTFWFLPASLPRDGSAGLDPREVVLNRNGNITKDLVKCEAEWW
jgi:hypothetical protein